MKRLILTPLLLFIAILGLAAYASHTMRPMESVKTSTIMSKAHSVDNVRARRPVQEAHVSLITPDGVEVTLVGDLLGHRTLSADECEPSSALGLSIVRGVGGKSPGEVKIEAPKKSIFMIFMEGPAGKKVCFDMTITLGSNRVRIKPTVNFNSQGLGHLSFGIDPATHEYHFGNAKSWLI